MVSRALTWYIRFRLQGVLRARQHGAEKDRPAASCHQTISGRRMRFVHVLHPGFGP